MKRSLTELGAACVKAARGAGFPLGHAEEFAQAAIRFAALHPKAVADLAAVLQEAPDAGTITVEDAHLTAKRAPVLMLGPILSDALITDVTHVTLENIYNSLLLNAFLHRVPFAIGERVKTVVASPIDTTPIPAGAVEIPDDIWQVIDRFAAKTYVPATEASRIAGAGAGLTDND